MKSIFKTGYILSGALLSCVLSFAQGKTNHLSTNKKKTKWKLRPRKKNKTSIRNLYENILNTGKLELLSEIISENYQGEKGSAGLPETVSSLRAGFPDIKWTIEDLVADGNKVIVRWSWKGTNKGAFKGFPPSNKEVHDSAIVIFEFNGDKVINAWTQSDRLGLLTQIGVLSPGLLTPHSNKTKEFSFLVRVPLSYSREQAIAVSPKWNSLIDNWKATGIYITSFAFPGESYIMTGKEKSIRQGAVVSDNLRVVSNIFLRSDNIKNAVELAKSFPILEFGGSIEVREIPPIPVPGN